MKQVVLTKKNGANSISYCFGDGYDSNQIEELNKQCDAFCMEAFLGRKYTGKGFSKGTDHTKTFLDSTIYAVMCAAQNIAALLNTEVEIITQ